MPRARHRDSLLRKWSEQFLAAGAERLSGKTERTDLDELRSQVSKLERALGRKTLEVEVEVAGELLLARLRDARGASSFRAGEIVASVAQTTPLGDRLWAVPDNPLWA